MLQAGEGGVVSDPRAVPLSGQALSTQILELVTAAAQLGKVNKGIKDSTSTS